MPAARLLPLVVIAVSLLLPGCGTAPVEPPPATPEPVPELTLNLPEEGCSCAEQTVLDFTPLERGFTALAAGEYIEAVQHFQRYQRLEKTPEADMEASVAIAYVSILRTSPFYDPTAARKSYRRLRGKAAAGMNLHEQTLLMRESLETFLVMEVMNKELKEDNATLRGDLEKREEALRRLRELALGQKAGR